MDDTVLIAGTQDTLSTLLHLLQHLAARIGFLLNGPTCQLLCIHSNLPISFSTKADPYTVCDCPFCAPFFHSTPDPDSLALPLRPLSCAKYLGSLNTPTSSSVPDVSYRCSQASSAFKTLDPFFRHPLVSPKFKLRVYSQIVQSILLHGSESHMYSPAHIARIDSLHYKARRQIFQVKSPYYHRVLQPSDSPCSSTYLLSLSYPVLPSCIPSSMRISDSRIKLLGHILRHPSSSESLICFNQSYSLRTISSPFRRGAPRAHWPELVLAEASHRAYLLHQAPPTLGDFQHSFFQHFTIVELKHFSSTSLKQWYSTRYIHLLLPIAEDRDRWKLLLPKVK